MRPDPSRRFPFHSAFALLTGMALASSRLWFRMDIRGAWAPAQARHDVSRQAASLAGRPTVLDAFRLHQDSKAHVVERADRDDAIMGLMVCQALDDLAEHDAVQSVFRFLRSRLSEFGHVDVAEVNFDAALIFADAQV